MLWILLLIILVYIVWLWTPPHHPAEYCVLWGLIAILGIVLLFTKYWIFGLLLFLIFIPTIIYYTAMAIGAYQTYVHRDANYFRNALAKVSSVLNPVTIAGNKPDYPVLYMCNHFYAGNFDTYIVTLLDSNASIIALDTAPGAKRRVLDAMDAIIVKKGESNFESTRVGIKDKIDSGKSVIIFPEGERVQNKGSRNEILEFRSGTFKVAKEFNIPIVPVYIDQGMEFWNLIVPGIECKMSLGDPVFPSNYSTHEELMKDVRQRMKLLSNSENN